MNEKLYMKKVICPICGKETIQPQCKTKTYKILKTDFDLYNTYDGINPAFYGVKFCNHCGYANVNSLFENPSENKNAYQVLLNREWKKWSIPTEYDVNFAIKLYKLVLLNKMIIDRKKYGDIAFISLQLYWLNKSKGNEKEMARFRKHALYNLEKGYNSEHFPFAKVLTEDKAMYLISILYGLEGDIDTSKQWLSRLFVRRDISYRIKEKARDFKEYYLKAN